MDDKERLKRKALYGTRASSKIFESTAINCGGPWVSNVEKSPMEQETKENKTWKDRLIISGDNKYKAIFDVFILFLVGYSCVTCVFYAAFKETDNELLLKFDFSIEFLFGLDLILNFFVSYLDTDTNLEVTDLRKIAKKYVFKGWFLVDFVSVFPFQIVFGGEGEMTKLFRLFRLPRLIKLIDISRFN